MSGLPLDRRKNAAEVRADYHRGDRKRRLAQGLRPDSLLHGTNTGYENYGCRCEKCRAASAKYRADKREAQRQREAELKAKYEQRKTE